MSSLDHTNVTREPRARSTLDVLEAIRQKAVITQPELVAATKLSRGTVAAVVRHLHQRQLIESAPLVEHSNFNADGRPPASIRFRSEAAPAVCVDLGSRHVAAGIGGLDGPIRPPKIRVFEKDLAATDALKIATSMVGEMLGEGPSSILPSDLVGVCVAIATPVDRPRGQVAPGGTSTWIGIRPAEELKYRLGKAWSEVPFSLHNNANLDILAEYEYGPVRRHLAGEQEVVLLMRWGNGIGGAALVDGDLLTGARGFATEIGHTPLHRRSEGTPPCPICGHYCLDSIASGNALTAELRKRFDIEISFDQLIERAVAGPGLERDIFTTAAENVGEMLGAFVSFLNAQLVVISGHHFGTAPHDVKAYTLVVDAIRAGMKRVAFSPTLEDLDIVLGERNRFSTVEGGIVAVLQERLPTFFESKAVTAA